MFNQKLPISGISKYFACCALECHKKLLCDFKLQLNCCQETDSAAPAAMNIKQHLFMSGVQP